MKLLGRLFLSTSVLALALTLPAHATSSLSFEGGGYWIDLEIGQTDHPVIAAVRFHAPGDTQGVVLPSRLVYVEAFDPKRQVLLLRYAGDENGTAPFTLSIKRQTATLDTGTKRIASRFTWLL